MKGLVLALGLSLLLVPSVAKAEKLIDPYILKIESGEILPPQYIGTDNKLIKDKIPSKEEWIESVESQAVGGGDKTLLISKKKKAIKIKKTDKKGKPLKGVVFKMYMNKENALNDIYVLDTQTTNEDGIVRFKHLPPYYGACIKESQTLENYQIRNEEKDIISVYRDNNVRFLGEIEPKNMKVTSINQNGIEKTLASSKNTNQELQSLTNEGENFNDTTNWLVFNDNGKEKLVAKKPIKYAVFWNSLYKAGVVFGKEGIDDLKNADFSKTWFYNSEMGIDSGKGKGTPKTYKPTYITVNGKKYIVRLIRGYNDNVNINNHPRVDRDSTDHYNAIKGSEWNRLILPLIDPTYDDSNGGYHNGTNGRYGGKSKMFVERNMPTLANYSWWTDFGGKNNSSGNYTKSRGYAAYRWTQETGYDDISEDRILRGSSTFYYGADYISSDNPNYFGSENYTKGWLPVLELVN